MTHLSITLTMPPKKNAMKRTNSDVIKELTKESKKQKTVAAPVDSLCPLPGGSKVHADFDCMLNQTNIGANNKCVHLLCWALISGLLAASST